MALIKKKLHGVIVGLGSIGNRHMKILASRTARLSVVRRSQPNNQFSPLDGVSVVHSIDDALAAQPDFAVICSPSHLHVQHAQQFVLAGVPVLIEKPLGGSLDESVLNLSELVQQSTAGDRCAMAYCMRYHPAYREARRLVRSRAIGRCLYAKAWFEGYLPDWHPWEDHRHSYAAGRDSAGGALRTLDHEIDYLNWTLGPADYSTGIQHNTGSIQIDADDVALIASAHPNGVQSQVTLAMCRKPPSRGFEFVGEDGLLCFTMESERLVKRSRAGKTETVVQVSTADIDQMYIDMMDDYLNLLDGKRTTSSIANVSDGVAAMSVIENVVDSLPSARH